MVREAISGLLIGTFVVSRLWIVDRHWLGKPIVVICGLLILVRLAFVDCYDHWIFLNECVYIGLVIGDWRRKSKKKTRDIIYLCYPEFNSIIIHMTIIW